MKWKSILGTVLIFLSIWFNWKWFWIVLAIPVTIEAFVKGEIHFFEEINRQNEPTIYWIQMSLLVFFDLYLIYESYNEYFLT